MKRMTLWTLALLAGCSAAFTTGLSTGWAVEGTKGPVHALAMHGAPKYAAGFKQYDYVNPNAPKGGRIVLGAIGTYDTFNPFIVKGTAAAGIGGLYEALMVANADEAFTLYCHLCSTVEVPDDRAWVEFTLRPEARWHDAKPITVEDVIWSFYTQRDKGRPFNRAYWKNIVKVEATGPNKVRFFFDDMTNPELPMIIGELAILPKHYWEGTGPDGKPRDFTATTLEVPLGSGPIKVKEFDTGRSITYERVKDYWGAKLPTQIGLGNFDEQRIDYYRDTTVMVEAFKGGNIDIRAENTARFWATSYNTPALAAGLFKKEEFKHSNPAGMQAYIMNTRRPIFQDRRVREAIGYAFDFEWSNATVFFGAYTRTASYWANSEMASKGAFADLPADSEERKILEKFRGRVPEEVFTKTFSLPKTDGSGNNRAQLRAADELLVAAGWIVKDGKRVNAQTGKPFEFEIVYFSATHEPYSLPFAQNLEKLGIKATVRTTDPSQYQRLMEDFDFDMTTGGFGQSHSPGNEQRSYWGTAGADEKGGRNSIGIKDKAIDELIELVISAPDRKSLVERTRALDRVLLWGHYVVPQWHIPHDRIAYWDRFGRPDAIPMRGVQTGAWWVDPVKDASLPARRAALR